MQVGTGEQTQQHTAAFNLGLELENYFEETNSIQFITDVTKYF